MSQRSGGTAVSAPAAGFVAWSDEEECYLNLAGDYDYLELPYYVSMDYEHDGKRIHPTCKEMLDAYVPPLFLEKARLEGIEVPHFYVSNGYFEPPVIIDPINPFMTRSRTVRKPGREQGIARSMTRNFTYAICCQELPPGSRIAFFRSVLGWCTSKRFRTLARAVWEVYAIPLARVRVVITEEGNSLLSDISPLPLSDLAAAERRRLEERIKWPR